MAIEADWDIRGEPWPRGGNPRGLIITTSKTAHQPDVFIMVGRRC